MLIFITSLIRNQQCTQNNNNNNSHLPKHTHTTINNIRNHQSTHHKDTLTKQNYTHKHIRNSQHKKQATKTKQTHQTNKHRQTQTQLQLNQNRINAHNVQTQSNKLYRYI